MIIIQPGNSESAIGFSQPFVNYTTDGKIVSVCPVAGNSCYQVRVVRKLPAWLKRKNIYVGMTLDLSGS